MDSICTKFATTVLLRRARFELYVFITSMHQNFGLCLRASQVLKRYVRKSGIAEEMAISMFWLLERSSMVKCNLVGSRDKSWPVLSLCVFLESHGIWCDPFEIPADPWKKGNKVFMPNSDLQYFKEELSLLYIMESEPKCVDFFPHRCHHRNS